MGKEIKLLIYILFFFLFIFFIIGYYISDENKKKTSLVIVNYSQDNSLIGNLPILKNDTDNIIEYVDNYDSINNSKKRNFWDLIK